jgi:diguanylate cyclase (GGDEF)-like protein
MMICKMSPQVSTVFATYLTQATGALLLAAVLASQHRAYRRPYLRLWAWSWWALAIYLVFGAGSLAIAATLPATHPLRLVFSGISQVAGYWQVVWLLFGTYEVATGRTSSDRLLRWLLLVFALVGLGSTLSFTDPGFSGARFFLRVALRSLAAGVAFAIAGIKLWEGWSPRGRNGRFLVSLGFGLYGIQQVHYFGLGSWQLLTGRFATYASFTGFVDIVLYVTIGLGMTIWLLEEERSRVVQATEQLEHLAYHDVLTGLPNRRLLDDRLGLTIPACRRRKEGLAVLALDVDDFAALNDSYGESFGDDLLRMVAARLKHSVREEDTVARQGGDEFVLLLPGLKADMEFEDARTRILAALSEPFTLRGRALGITMSAGVSLFPRDGDDGETLLRNADAALRAAKARGRGTIRHFDASISSSMVERLSVESSLRRAFGQREFELFYQPIVETRSGRAVAVEALLRWRHPERGLLPPLDFLAVAEATGLMDEITGWILGTACRNLREFRAIVPRLRVSVNLSARPFQHPDLILHVEEALRVAGIEPDGLTLEVTETVAMLNVEAGVRVLHTLRSLGVRVCIDDFGTGYSSLAYLRDLPVDAIKIDQSFVRDLSRGRPTRTIVHAMVDLARGLGIEAIAEGVEDEEQRASLEKLGCNAIQGFFIAAPASVAQCGQWLTENSTA